MAHRVTEEARDLNQLAEVSLKRKWWGYVLELIQKEMDSIPREGRYWSLNNIRWWIREQLAGEKVKSDRANNS